MESGASGEGGDQIQVGHIQGSKAIAIGRGATAIYQGLSVEEVAVLVTELKRVDQPKVWDGRYPYLGLTSFQESDAEFFFGRESLVADLLARVQKANFIVIAGPSGSGKSSVARAGLFHALKDGRLERSDTWLLATMLPKGNPIEQLAEAVARLAKSPAAGDYLKQEGMTDPLALSRQVETLLTDDPRQRCVLLVDQFEETFTQTKDEEVRAAFVDLLTTAAATEKGRMIIVLSLRADFVSHCARYPQLRTLMSQQFQLVGAMEPAELAKAITLPALEVGATIDPALVSRIMADMKGEPGALPLMSFALRDLFEAEKSQKGQPMDMTLPEYLQRGGIESALERHANQVFDHFTADQKALAQNIFSKLIEVGQGRVDTRRTAVFSELVPKGVDETAVAEIVNQLAQEGVRLITTSGGESDEEIAATNTLTTVTIAHEKLIDAWPWLRQLVDENREAIVLQNQITSDAQTWAKDQDAGYLYRGGRLAQVEEKLAELGPNLDELSQQFIQDSLAAREAERQARAERIQKEEALRQEQANAGRFRRLTRWLSIAAGVAVIATIVALFFLNIARQESAVAVSAQSTSEVNAEAASAGEALAAVARETAVANANLANAESTRAFAAQATANYNAHIANTREAEAIAARYLAATSEAEALAAATEIAQLKDTIQASQMASAVQAELVQDPELALLLAVAGLGLSDQLDTQASFYKAIFSPYRATLYDNIRLATFSPSGDLIATVGRDNTAIVWSVNGSERVALDGHKDGITSISFSPTGNLILTTSHDGTAKLWGIDGSVRATLGGHKSFVSTAAFSPNGDLVVTVSWDTAKIWGVDGSEGVTLIGHTEYINSVAFSPAGDLIVTASNDDTAKVWGVDGSVQALLSGHGEDINKAIFSPMGDLILTSSTDGTVKVWGIDGRALTTLSGSLSGDNPVVISPAGDVIVTTVIGNIAKVWGVDGSERATLPGHTEDILSVTFNPTGDLVVTTSYDNTVRVWRWLTGSQLAVLSGHKADVRSAMFSPAGDLIVTVDADEEARIWAVGGGEQVKLDGDTDVVVTAAFNPMGDLIVTAGSDGMIKVWGADGFERATLIGHMDQVWLAEFSPTGNHILTASRDGMVKVWGSDGSDQATLTGYITGANSATFNSAGDLIVIASENNTAKVWGVDGSEQATLVGHTDKINSVAFNPVGDLIVTASNDGKAIIWGVDGTQVVTLSVPFGAMLAAFNPQGDLIVTTSFDGGTKLWGVDGTEQATLVGHRGLVHAVAFSPASDLIATASIDGTVMIWGIDGSERARLEGPITNRINSVAFAPTGDHILISKSDGLVQVWGVDGSSWATPASHWMPIYSATFNSDGDRILTASADGTAKVWPVYPTLASKVAVAWPRINRGFTEAECQQYYRDDLGACPRTKEDLFAPLAAYLPNP